MDMKKIKYLLSAFTVSCAMVLSLGACSDYFDPELTGVVGIDNRTIQQERDAFYQMNGILQLMQQIGDGYVVAGELRSDLVSQTANSSQDLRDIEFFSADSTNSYLIERKLYELVNNCNYLISAVDHDYMGAKADTLVAQSTCIRSWAFMQLALDYGHAYYYTDPVLSDDDEVEVQKLGVDQLVDVLIADLLPYLPADGVSERLPFSTGQYATINSYATSYLFIPVRYMLAELYMWKENFAEAARLYYQLMLDRKLTTPLVHNRWRNSQCTDINIHNWNSQFSSLSSNNQLFVIPFSSDFVSGQTRLPQLFDSEFQLSASTQCHSIFQSQTYSADITVVSTRGDLRGYPLTTDYGCYVMRTAKSTDEVPTDAHVVKYNNLKASGSSYVPVARAAKIYLRYAEAVNRLGLHQLAFAVLKYGLNATTMLNTNYVGKTDYTAYPFTDFGQVNLTLASTFNGNEPLHSRGCGDSYKNSTFAIDTNTGIDSLTDVENKIMDEYVLECAFEGGRFHDLMRISQYRRSPKYLAEKVAAKLATVSGTPLDVAGWTSYLENKENWYLPSRSRR